MDRKKNLNSKKRLFSFLSNLMLLQLRTQGILDLQPAGIFKAAWIELVVSFIRFITYFFRLWQAIEFGKLAHAQTKYPRHRKTTKKQEPVSSTSRRGARAAYHDEYPRDFGPRIAYTVS